MHICTFSREKQPVNLPVSCPWRLKTACHCYFCIWTSFLIMASTKLLCPYLIVKISKWIVKFSGRTAQLDQSWLKKAHWDMFASNICQREQSYEISFYRINDQRSMYLIQNLPGPYLSSMGKPISFCTFWYEVDSTYYKHCKLNFRSSDPYLNLYCFPPLLVRELRIYLSYIYYAHNLMFMIKKSVRIFFSDWMQYLGYLILGKASLAE